MVTSTFFLLFVIIGELASNFLLAVLIVWSALGLAMSFYESVRNVGLPLMLRGRPLHSLVMTIIMTCVFFIPTMYYIPVRLMGGFDYEKK